MKRSKYTDEQILAIVKEGEAGRKVTDLCRTHGTVVGTVVGVAIGPGVYDEIGS